MLRCKNNFVKTVQKIKLAEKNEMGKVVSQCVIPTAAPLVKRMNSDNERKNKQINKRMKLDIKY